GFEVMILAVLVDERQRRAVERTGADVPDTRAEQPLAQFVARLAREGHREDLVGRDLLLTDAALDPQRQDVGLARSGGRAYEQSTRGRHHRLTLLGRQAHEERVREGSLV